MKTAVYIVMVIALILLVIPIHETVHIFQAKHYGWEITEVKLFELDKKTAGHITYIDYEIKEVNLNVEILPYLISVMWAGLGSVLLSREYFRAKT